VLAAMPPTRCRVTHADGDESTDEARGEARDDIQRFLESRLAAGTAGSAASAVDLIVERSESRFLYVYVLLRLAAADTAVLADPPHGIDGLYAALFSAACGGAADFGAEERAVLETMAAAKSAVHWFDELPLLSGVDAATCGEVVQRFKEVVVRRDDGRVRWFHKSVRDWLVGAGGAFRIAPDDAAQRMAEAVLVPLEGLAAEPPLPLRRGGPAGAADPPLLGYAVRYGVAHLCEAGRLDAVRGRLLDFAWLLRRVRSEPQGPVVDWEL